MTASQSVAANTAPKAVKRTRPQPQGTGSPIEQTLMLRDALRTAARQANDLIRSLKRHKRQSRIVETTLASLKELQKVAG